MKLRTIAAVLVVRYDIVPLVGMEQSWLTIVETHLPRHPASLSWYSGPNKKLKAKDARKCIASFDPNC